MPDPSQTSIPLTWAVGVSLTFVGLWVPVILAMVAQARSFGALQAKIDLVLKHVDTVDDLRERMVKAESWIDSIKGYLGDRTRASMASTEPGGRV